MSKIKAFVHRSYLGSLSSLEDKVNNFLSETAGNIENMSVCEGTGSDDLIILLKIRDKKNSDKYFDKIMIVGWVPYNSLELTIESIQKEHKVKDLSIVPSSNSSKRNVVIAVVERPVVSQDKEEKQDERTDAVPNTKTESGIVSADNRMDEGRAETDSGPLHQEIRPDIRKEVGPKQRRSRKRS